MTPREEVPETQFDNNKLDRAFEELLRHDATVLAAYRTAKLAGLSDEAMYKGLVVILAGEKHQYQQRLIEWLNTSSRPNEVKL